MRTWLALELGVSRGTARAALRSLEEQGLITRQRGRGTYVNQDHVMESLAAKELASGEPAETAVPNSIFEFAERYCREPIDHTNAGISTVLCGPGEPEQAHTVDERIDVADIRDAIGIFAGLCLAARHGDTSDG